MSIGSKLSKYCQYTRTRTLRWLTGAGFERTKLLERHRDVRMPCSRSPGRKRYRRDSGPAYAALDMPVPDTYAVVVRGETHQMD